MHASIDRLFTDFEGGPGGAATIVRDGVVVHHRGYGLADVEHRVPFGTDQPFAMASVTKTFIAYAVHLLEIRGALGREDELHHYVSEMGDLGAPVTLDHLMRHRSGIRDYITLASLAGGRLLEGLTTQSIRALITSQRSLDFAPDTAVAYSNSNYVLLSWVLERVTGLPLPDAMQQLVFGPLGMDHTVIVENPAEAPPTPMRGYEGTPTTGYRPWALRSHMAGDGGAWSTLDDISVWLRRVHEFSGDSRLALDRMMERRPLADGSSTDYLAGLREGTQMGERWVGHSGGFFGARSQVCWFPGHGIGAAVIANQTINPIAAVTEVVDRVMQPALADGIAGTYRSSELNTDWIVAADGSSITITPSGSFGTIDAVPFRRTSECTFVPTRAGLHRWDLEFDTEVAFRCDADGVVTGLSVRADIVRGAEFRKVLPSA